MFQILILEDLHTRGEPSWLWGTKLNMKFIQSEDIVVFVCLCFECLLEVRGGALYLGRHVHWILKRFGCFPLEVLHPRALA